MAEYTENGLSLRWGAPDLVTSDPQGPGARIIVAAHPPHPSNVVTAVYTVDGGAVRIARGFRLPATARPAGEEWFAVDLPRQPDGVLIAFAPVLSCSGREADPRRGGFALSSLAQPSPPPMSRGWTGAAGRAAPARPARFAFEPEFLFRVTVPLERDKDPVGETPDGLRFNFAIGMGGRLDGPALAGEILHRGGDWMRVRQDGVGIANIHALIKPDGGGIVLTEYGGAVDFGPDGYQSLIAGGGPKRAPIRLAPRYLTAEPRLSWMNRLQCLGIGEVNLERYLVEYDLYRFR